MYKIKCLYGNSIYSSKNKSWLNYYFSRLELIKFYIEKLSVLHPDCIFEITDEEFKNV